MSSLYLHEQVAIDYTGFESHKMTGIIDQKLDKMRQIKAQTFVTSTEIQHERDEEMPDVIKNGVEHQQTID